MDPETNHQTQHEFRRLPKGERRVRFADSMGMELVSIFLFDLISNYYFASIHKHKQLPPPKSTISKLPPKPITSHHHHHHNYTPSLAPHESSQRTTTTLQPAAAVTTTTTTTASDGNNNSNSNYHHPHNNNTNHHYHQNNSPKQITAYTSSSNTQHSTSSSNHYQSSSHYSGNNNNNNNNNNYVTNFTQPISLISFKERVKLNKVHLETCNVDSRAGNISVTCTIRVLNLSYDKSVLVRYTTDEWHTYTDSLASYKPGSNDNWSDRFTSTFSVVNQVKQFQTGQRIIFAIRYTYDGKIYWDNNGGLNYVVKKV